MFKENVKVLMGFLLDKSLDAIIQPDTLNNLIIKEMNKGEFKEIEEEEEENGSSVTNSLLLTNVR